MSLRSAPAAGAAEKGAPDRFAGPAGEDAAVGIAEGSRPGLWVCQDSRLARQATTVAAAARAARMWKGCPHEWTPPTDHPDPPGRGAPARERRGRSLREVPPRVWSLASCSIPG